MRDEDRSDPLSDVRKGHFAVANGHLRTMLDLLGMVPVLAWAMDVDGVIRVCEGRGTDQIGFLPEEIIGKSVFELFADVPAVIAGARKGLSGDEFTDDVDLNGRRLRTTHVPQRDGQGDVVGVVGLSLDITERYQAQQALKASERQARSLIEAIPMGMHMYRLEESGRLIFEGANPSADSVLGVDNQQFVGRTIEEAFPALADSEIPTRYREAANHGVPWRTEQVAYEEGGIAGAFDVWAFQTGPGRMAAVFEDITSRKRNEVEISRHRERLEELVEERTAKLGRAQEALVRKERLAALGQLTASVAHELRNPLGAVRSAVFALGESLESGQPEQTRRAAALAEQCVVRCDAIIEGLLSYSRVGQLRLEETDIDAWIAQQLDEQLPEDLSCIRNLDCGAMVPVDRDKLRRALLNVLSNATQSMSHLAPVQRRLTVSTAVDGDSLWVRVQDIGQGIAPDLLEQVFEPLFSTKKRGVGLGLPTVCNIIRQHDGDVQLDSQPDTGTTVTLRLPLRPAKAGPE